MLRINNSISSCIKKASSILNWFQTEKKVDEIISSNEIDSGFSELQKLKLELRKDPNVLGLLIEKIDKISEKVYLMKEDTKDDLLTKSKYMRKLWAYCEFIYIFYYLKENWAKTVVEKNENTKKEILMIWQTHYRKEIDDPLMINKTIESQKLIEVFIEYFLEDGLTVWNEGVTMDIKWLKNPVKMQHSWDWLYLWNVLSFLEKTWNIKVNFIDFEVIIDITNKDDKKKIDEFAKSLSEIEFIWKPYRKADNYKIFYWLLTIKYFINKYFKKDNDLKYLFWVEHVLKNKQRRKFINMETPILIEKNLTKYTTKEDLDNMNIWFNAIKTIDDICYFIIDELKTDEERIEFVHKIEENPENILDIFMEFFPEWNTEEHKYYLWFLEQIYWKRELEVIKNIDKRIPKNQKEVPIIFWAWHLKNWKRSIEKHNKENPDNHYSLRTIDLSKIIE